NDEFIVPGSTNLESRPFSEPGVIHQIPSTPRYLAIDSEYLYWTNTGLVGEEEKSDEEITVRNLIADYTGTTGRVKLGESGPEEEDPEFITGASNPQGIAVDSEYVYWANRTAGANPNRGNTGLGRAAISGEGAPDQVFCRMGDLSDNSND